MNSFFSRNLETKGRIVRGVLASVLFIGAAFGFTVSVWLGLLLVASGAFTLFEAASGWCAVRACGVKTRI